MTTKNVIVDFLLKEERALIPGLFFLPFRNALMKGATMDEEAAAYLRKIRWVGVVIIAVLLANTIAEPSESINDKLLGFFLAAFLVTCALATQIALIGHQHRDVVPTDKVAMFDLNVAKSGGLWGALGLGIWSLFKLFFAS